MTEPPTDNKLIIDVLERIDKLTNHIIDIKGDMYRRSEFREDSARIYDHIGSIQTQVLMTIKEAVLGMDSQAKRLEGDLRTMETELRNQRSKAIPGWLLAAGASVGTALLTGGIPLLLQHVTFGAAHP